MTTDTTIIRAAGVALVANGKLLLLRRTDAPPCWGLPGGKAEGDESTEDAARRECLEETGYMIPGALRFLADSNNGAVAYTTWGRAVDQFEPVLNHEHDAAAWAPLDDLPAPLHPGVQLLIEGGALDALDVRKMNELDLARGIAAGELASPQRCVNVSLFALRITGTGVAYRSGLDEMVYRRPENYLNDEFLQRCNGLAVVMEHPEKKALDSKEFASRVIGAIVLPYLQGNEVWGVAKIYDDVAIEVMTTRQVSTSPGVYFRDPTVNMTAEMAGGERVLIEGDPSLLDHLAVCELGVWDKGGAPAGVLNTNINEGIIIMSDEEKKAAEEAKAKADAEGDPIKKLCDSVGALMSRMDAMEAGRAKADADMPGDPAQVAADKAKADAEEDEKKTKADSAIRARIDAVERMIPKAISDADYAAMADAQARADSVACAFGDSAPRPLQGETLLAYRKRLAAGFKAHSAAWKDVDLHAIADSAVLAIAEKQIYADADEAGRHPAAPIDGGLREIIRRDSAGRQISTFVGKPSAWMDQFKSPSRRVININKEA